MSVAFAARALAGSPPPACSALFAASLRPAASAMLAACAVVAAALGAGCSDGGTTTVTITPAMRGAERFADPALGREGNLVACADCHGTGDDAIPMLTGASLARVTERPSFWGGQEVDLLRSVNHCLFWFMGGQPLVAGDPDGNDLFAYLASLEGDDTLAAAQPFSLGLVAWPGAGDAARGEAVYRDACKLCHGARFSGDSALITSSPVLPEETLAAHPDGEYTAEERRLVFVEKVRHGPFLGYGGTMPPFSTEVLTDADLADLFSYLEVP